MAAENLPDLVDHACPRHTGILAECCQAPILLIGRGRDIDLPQTTDRLALQQPGAVRPQQFAQRGCIASIRFSFLSFFGLNHDHLLAAVVIQHPDQPIVEAADFEDNHELLATLQTLAGELLEECMDFLWPRRDLPSQQDITGFVSKRNRNLTCMLVQFQGTT